MPRRNAHAVAARARHAGPMKTDGAEQEQCAECGKDMGYGSPSVVCAPCDIYGKRLAQHDKVIDDERGDAFDQELRDAEHDKALEDWITAPDEYTDDPEPFSEHDHEAMRAEATHTPYESER